MHTRPTLDSHASEKDAPALLKQDLDTIEQLLAMIEQYQENLTSRKSYAKKLFTLSIVLAVLVLFIPEYFLLRIASNAKTAYESCLATLPTSFDGEDTTTNAICRYEHLRLLITRLPPIVLLPVWLCVIMISFKLTENLWSENPTISPNVWLPLLTIIHTELLDDLHQLETAESNHPGDTYLPTDPKYIKELETADKTLSGPCTMSAASHTLNEIATTLENIKGDLNKTKTPISLLFKSERRKKELRIVLESSINGDPTERTPLLTNHTLTPKYTRP